MQKGLGRAWQWASGGRLDDEPLLEACLRDRRFDVQLECSRGDWLWRMVRAVGAAGRFRVPILHALYDLSDDRSADQLCELAFHYAEAGDETFRLRLYEIVGQNPVAGRLWLAEEEIVRLDGGEAFLFAARVRGRSLTSRGWEWHDEWLVERAAERLGREYVEGLLRASSDEAIRHFGETWRREKQSEGEGGPPRPRRPTSVEEAIRAAEDDGEWFRLRYWGRSAGETDLRTFLDRLWSTREPRVVARLLSALSVRPLLSFDARLIDLCRHGDPGVERAAFAALAQNTHPLIRDFASAELRKGISAGSSVSLFIRNYRQGDERRILEAMEFPEDVVELHWLLRGVIDVLEGNPEADRSRLGVIAYASTPCEFCRSYAARLLIEGPAAPAWLAEECRHDSGEYSRELVEKAADSGPVS